jgi:hypothetical protein
MKYLTKKCTECYGEGWIEHERIRPGSPEFPHGRIWTESLRCDHCDGEGEEPDLIFNYTSKGVDADLDGMPARIVLMYEDGSSAEVELEDIEEMDEAYERNRKKYFDSRASE